MCALWGTDAIVQTADITSLSNSVVLILFIDVVVIFIAMSVI